MVKKVNKENLIKIFQVSPFHLRKKDHILHWHDRGQRTLGAFYAIFLVELTITLNNVTQQFCHLRHTHRPCSMDALMKNGTSIMSYCTYGSLHCVLYNTKVQTILLIGVGGC